MWQDPISEIRAVLESESTEDDSDEEDTEFPIAKLVGKIYACASALNENRNIMTNY